MAFFFHFIHGRFARGLLCFLGAMLCVVSYQSLRYKNYLKRPTLTYTSHSPIAIRNTQTKETSCIDFLSAIKMININNTAKILSHCKDLFVKKDISAESNTPVVNKTLNGWSLYRAQKGDTFFRILRKNGVSIKDAYKITNTLLSTSKPPRISVGQEIKLLFQKNTLKTIQILQNPEIIINFSNKGYSVNTKNNLPVSVIEEKHHKVLAKVSKAQILEPKDDLAKVKTIQRKTIQQPSILKKKSYEITMIKPYIHQHKSMKCFVGAFNPMSPLGQAISMVAHKGGVKLRNGQNVSVVFDGDKSNLKNIKYIKTIHHKSTIEIFNLSNSLDHLSLFDSNGKKLNGQSFSSPMQNWQVNSGFGMRRARMHTGVDLQANIGDPVYAAADGIISKACFTGNYGKYILIAHTSKYASGYAHLQQYVVKPGQKVSKGQLIGYVGMTGRTSGPHLHFEVLENNQRVNPINFIKHERMSPSDFAIFTRLQRAIRAELT